ncbi:MAG: alpha/beta fold hydrolase [Beijerinckiaceae bacterium]
MLSQIDFAETESGTPAVAARVRSVGVCAPVPVCFQGCAGILHPGRSSTGVVILSPFGYEAMASCKSFRLLAEAIAARGFPVLRFDFPGTGDSSGDSGLPDILASREAGAKLAANFLREGCGVEDVVFLGFRLGASIAALAAETCNVKKLILIEPVVSGRAWLREQDVLFRFAGFGADVATPVKSETGHEYLGHTISNPSYDKIKALNFLTRAAGASAGDSAMRILVLAGPATFGAQQYAESWSARGADVEICEFDGFAAMMADPVSSVPPMAGFEPVYTWLGSPPLGPIQTRLPDFDSVLQGDGYSEQGTYYGESGRLFGILCEPSGRRLPAPAFVLINTGGNPHTGWGRQTVLLARHLARQGYVTFRIDLSGIGEARDADDPSRPLVYTDATAADVSAAVDWLAVAGFERPALVGICSGAYAGFKAILADKRPGALLMINLQKFYWTEGDKPVLYRSVGSYISMLKNRDVFKRILSGEVDVAGIAGNMAKKVWTMVKVRAERLAPAFVARPATERPDALRDMRKCLRAGVRIRMAYTAGDGGEDEMNTYLGHRGRLLQNEPLFDVEIIEDAGHNFETSADRAKLFTAVESFAKLCCEKAEAAA